MQIKSVLASGTVQELVLRLLKGFIGNEWEWWLLPDQFRFVPFPEFPDILP